MSKKVTVLTSLYAPSPENKISYFNSLKNQTCLNLADVRIYEVGTERKDPEINHNWLTYKIRPERISIYETWDAILNDTDAPLFCNYNFDDVFHFQHLEKHIYYHEIHPEVDITYAPFLETNRPNETMSNNSSGGRIYPCPDFNSESKIENYSHCCIFAKRRCLDKIGGFAEGGYRICGDYNWQVRAQLAGLRFAKITNSPLGLYYRNPSGLSSDARNISEALEEIKRIRNYAGE